MRSRWSPRLGRSRIGTIGAAITIAIVAAACSSTSTTPASTTSTPQAPIPTVITTGLPTAWAPVPYGNFQIGIPGTWLVSRNGGIACGPGFGSVFLGAASTIAGQKHCSSIEKAWFEPLSQTVQLPATRTEVVNGIEVQAALANSPSSATFYVPDQGFVLSAEGPNALTILGTLTHSPLAVVTATAAPTSTPKSWRSIAFAGVTLKVPGSWAVQRTDDIGFCQLSVNKETILLSSARTLLSPSCPPTNAQASDLTANQGLDVFSGPHATAALADPVFSRRLTVNGLVLRISQYSETGGVIVATISLPGQPYPVVLWLGLGGDGLTARAIVDSLHAN